MATDTRNQLEGRYGGLTLEGRPHMLSPVFVVLLRLVMGGMILFAGLGKFAFVSGEGFNASGYLVHGVDPASPVSGLYAWMASSPLLLDVINVIIPVTQVLIGIALITGAFVRLAALGGAMQMLAFYLGGWEGEFLALGAFAAGRIAGLDRYIEQYEVGGVPLVERVPLLRYLLG